jgi:hypothetical protein
MAAHLFLGRFLSVFLLVLLGLAGMARADHFLTHPAAADGLTPIGPQAAAAWPRPGTAARPAWPRLESPAETTAERAPDPAPGPAVAPAISAASGPAPVTPSTAAAADRPSQAGGAPAPSEPPLARVSATVAPQAPRPALKVTEAAPQAPETAPGAEKVLAKPAGEPGIEREIKVSVAPKRKPEIGPLVRVSLGGDARAPASGPATSRSKAVPQASKTAARAAKKLFEKGKEIKIKRDANVYLTPRNIPKNDRYLKAYDADTAAESNANVAPGLLGIATQTYRTQSSAGTVNKAYSLADAMRDAVWRKKTAAKLKTLMSERKTCADGEDGATRAKPSIGLGNSC